MLHKIFLAYQLLLLALFTWVFVYMVWKSFKNKRALYIERQKLEKQEEYENGIIIVRYDGVDVPMRRKERELWELLSHKEKCDRAENIRRGLRKGKIVRVDGGYKKAEK